jgi:hypothetical protein
VVLEVALNGLTSPEKVGRPEACLRLMARTILSGTDGPVGTERGGPVAFPAALDFGSGARRALLGASE